MVIKIIDYFIFFKLFCFSKFSIMSMHYIFILWQKYYKSKLGAILGFNNIEISTFVLYLFLEWFLFQS